MTPTVIKWQQGSLEEADHVVVAMHQTFTPRRSTIRRGSHDDAQNAQSIVLIAQIPEPGHGTRSDRADISDETCTRPPKRQMVVLGMAFAQWIPYSQTLLAYCQLTASVDLWIVVFLTCSCSSAKGGKLMVPAWLKCEWHAPKSAPKPAAATENPDAQMLDHSPATSSPAESLLSTVPTAPIT